MNPSPSYRRGKRLSQVAAPTIGGSRESEPAFWAAELVLFILKFLKEARGKDKERLSLGRQG